MTYLLMTQCALGAVLQQEVIPGMGMGVGVIESAIREIRVLPATQCTTGWFPYGQVMATCHRRNIRECVVQLGPCKLVDARAPDCAGTSTFGYFCTAPFIAPSRMAARAGGDTSSGPEPSRGPVTAGTKVKSRLIGLKESFSDAISRHFRIG